MKFILYITLSIFLETGEPLEHKFTLSFNEVKSCNEFKKVVDVGIAFFRLANEDVDYSAYVSNCKRVEFKTKKNIT